MSVSKVALLHFASGFLWYSHSFHHCTNSLFLYALHTQVFVYAFSFSFFIFFFSFSLFSFLFLLYVCLVFQCIGAQQRRIVFVVVVVVVVLEGHALSWSVLCGIFISLSICLLGLFVGAFASRAGLWSVGPRCSRRVVFVSGCYRLRSPSVWVIAVGGRGLGFRKCEP